jgi:hypothetical protein
MVWALLVPVAVRALRLATVEGGQAKPPITSVAEAAETVYLVTTRIRLNPSTFSDSVCEDGWESTG